MKTPKRKFSASFKAKVAIEAIKEQTSLQELAAKFELHPPQISSWKRVFLKNAELAFGSKSEKEDSDSDTASLSFAFKLQRAPFSSFYKAYRLKEGTMKPEVVSGIMHRVVPM